MMVCPLVGRLVCRLVGRSYVRQLVGNHFLLISEFHNKSTDNSSLSLMEIINTIHHPNTLPPPPPLPLSGGGGL